MKVVFILFFCFVFSIMGFSQPEPVLTQNDLMQTKIERSALQYMKINLLRTYIMEVEKNELTGRKALVSEVYYDKNACPESIVYFDSAGNRSQYTHYLYNSDLYKTEEIFFNSDSTLIGGVAIECDSSGITKAFIVYNKNAEITSEYKFLVDPVKNIIVAQISNKKNNKQNYKYYHITGGMKDGRIASVENFNENGILNDSISYHYNQAGQLSFKQYFDSDRKAMQETWFFYNDEGAVEKTQEINILTSQQRSFSYAYDEYGNRTSLIESDKNNKIISYYRFEYFSRVLPPEKR
ncbi:MAG TPA: hypothetical protein PLP11_06255 [Bacteroidales bacterium]|nr:hypothetical protein [Bacteroidales bacterium]HQP04187.1 hypothetical protein [Bacteroidales bacterium]